MYDEVDDCPVPPTANLRYTADDNNTGGRSMPGAQAIEGIGGTSGSGFGRGNYEEEDAIAKQRAKSQRGAERTIELHCSGTDPTPFNVAQLNDDEDDAAKQRIRDEMNVLHRSKPAATTPTAAAASSPPTPKTDQLQQQEQDEMDQKPAATIVDISSPPPPQQSSPESSPDTHTTFEQAVSTLSSRFHRDIEEPPSPTENSNYPEFELSDKPQPLPSPSFHRSRAHTRRNNQGSNNSTSATMSSNSSTSGGANEDISSLHDSSSGLPVLEATLVPEIPIYNATPVPEVDEREEEKDHGAGDDIKDDDIEKNLSANDDDDDGGGSKIFNSNDYDYDEQQLDQQHWCRRYQKWIYVGLGVVLVFIIAMAVMAALQILSGGNNGIETESSSSGPSTPPNIRDKGQVWIQRGSALLGDKVGDESGTSVALSRDGGILAVGSPGATDNDDRPGYVKVYTKQQQSDSTMGGWKWKHVETFIGVYLGDRFGESISISEDGNTVAVGAPGWWEMKDRPGYVRVYTREGDKWIQLGEDIEGEYIGDQCGFSVSLSSDGKTVAIGASSNDGNGTGSGHVRIYNIVGGSSWKQVGDLDGEAAHDGSGYAVSLSADGKTVVIGAPTNGGNGERSGHVRIYNLGDDDDEWKQVGRDIDGENIGDWLGGAVSISSDGKTVAVGSHYNTDNGVDSGKVKVYRLDNDDEWVQIGQDMVGELDDYAGYSVSLSSDGKMIAIGYPGNSNQAGRKAGRARVYRLDDSDLFSLSWIQVGKDIIGAKAGDGSGWTVSLSLDGKVVAIGSDWNRDNGFKAGHVRVFSVDDLDYV